MRKFLKQNMKAIVFSVAVCAVSVLNVQIMLDSEHPGDMAATTLAAVGEGGSGESGESGQICSHTVTTSESEQDCYGKKMRARITIDFKCTGQGFGACEDGAIYHFFDCEGVIISSQYDYRVKNCQ